MAVKFYVDPDLMERCERRFKRQGLKLSEGMSRLLRLLDESSDTLVPVLLDQAPGDAAKVLAKSVIAGTHKRTYVPEKLVGDLSEKRASAPR